MKKPTTLANAMAQIDGAFLPLPMEQAALQVLDDAMMATCFVRGPDIGSDGQRKYIEVPDHAIRVTAAVRVIEWRRGKPSAQLTINNLPPNGGGRSSPVDLIKMAAQNPDIVQQILDSFVEQAKRVGPTEVTTPTEKTA